MKISLRRSGVTSAALMLAACAMFISSCATTPPAASNTTAATTTPAASNASAAPAAAASSATTAPATNAIGSTTDRSNQTYYWISQNSTLPLFAAHDLPAWKKAGQDLGVKVEIAGPTTIDLPAFIATINQVCAQKPAGVAVVGWDPSLTAAVDQCIAQGVPTVTDDADLPDSKRLAFIGTDWYNIGVAQAEAMIAATGGKGDVATLSIINADNMKSARRGFADTLAAKAAGMNIVAEEDDGGDSSQAATKTAALLAAYPTLVGIAGFDSESGAGTVRALEEAGKIGQIKVTAMEQSPEFFKTVKDGKVEAIIIQKRALFTYYALQTLYDYVNNGLSIGGLSRDVTSTVPRIVDTGLLVATKTNIDQVIGAVASGAPPAPGPATKPDASETYYWISQNSTLPLFAAHDLPALKKAGQDLGVKVEIAGPTTIDLPAFIATINQVCAQKPAGVTVVGWDPSLTAAVDQCIAQGVPTVTDDADLPNSKRLAFIGTDWYNIGVAQAEAMIAATGGKGDVATLSIINADNMKSARTGFAATLVAKAPGMNIVAEEDDGGDSSQAATKTAALLAAYPNLVGIAGFDSESGAGTVRALEEAGKIGQVKVTAMEQSPEFFKTVNDGKVEAIIIQKRALFTYYAIKALYDHNHNNLTIGGLGRDVTSIIPRMYDTGLVVATKDNIDAVITAAATLPK